jgi:allantoinase
MPILHAAGLPLLVHAELVSPVASAGEARSYAAYLASRPRHWEHDAIRLLITLCEKYRCSVHIVHLSSADAVPMIAQARAAGLPLTVETCPHYLYFAAEEIADGDPRFKCAPPIRERDNRERLWEALRSGLIDTIGSDHSPAPPVLKHLDTGDLQRAWGGIASLQLSLSITWTAARARGFALDEVVRWMSDHPAKLVGIADCKGELAAGCDADIVVFDPDAEFVVDGSRLHHRHKFTPYEGQRLQGQVVRTYLRGRVVYDSGKPGDAPAGQILFRTMDDE